MRWIICGFFLVLSQWTWGQVTVEGFVRDELGQAIPFAHVAVKHQEMEGTVSKVNGFFSMEAGDLDTLVFSHIGFKSLEIAVDTVFNSRYISVKLPADFVQLDAVYVLANHKYKVPARYQGQPYDIDGVEKRAAKKPVRPGSVRGGGGTPAQGEPVPGPSAVLYGPISFFTQKEARQAQQAEESTSQTMTFQLFVNDGAVRDSLMTRYNIEERHLNALLVEYNQNYPQVHAYTDVEDIWRSITSYFDGHREMN